MNARPITWPTVPKGKDRVRVCLHAGNTEQEVEMLAREMVGWALEEAKGRSGIGEVVTGRLLASQSKL